MNLNADERIAMIDELTGDKCRCGSWKKIGRTFCGACYRQLPREMQSDLYKRFGRGYEEAYQEALKYFQQRGASHE